MRDQKPFAKVSILLLTLALIVVLTMDVQAIPAFARKYKTSCSTCHYAFPKLNGFGKAFKNNGYRYPAGQDAEMVKEEPVSLGSDAYKRVWPDAIWPTDMAGTAPFAVQAINRVHYFESNKQSSFEAPHEFALFYGGTFDDKISYFGEVEWEHESEMGYGFNVQYDFNPGLHLRFGTVGLEHATPEGMRLTAKHYNVAVLENQSGTWSMGENSGGMELWGAVNGAGGKGGLTYSVGTANGQHDGENFDINNAKDVFARVTYKIGGLGEAGGTEGQGSSSSAFYIDNSLRFGGIFYSGNASSSAAANDKFTVIGGDVDWWMNRLNVVGTVITMNSDYLGVSRKSLAYFIEGNYVLYPWLIAYSRFEQTKEDRDSDMKAQQSLVPAVIVMIRANVKASFEYKVPLDDASKHTGGFTTQVSFGF